MRKLTIMALILSFIINFNVYAFAQPDFPSTGSPSVILIDSKSGQILYEKNSHQRLYPASITKVMTALLTLENSKLDDKTIASKNAAYSIEPGSSTAGFQPDEELTIEQLLYALLLNSANEAANILAEHIGGTIENFAEMMNNRAKELGAQDTHFVNPNGLHKDDHYTTVYDMALIARQAMTMPEFRKIVSTTLYQMAPTNKYSKNDKHFLNGNKLIKVNHSKSPTNYYYPDAIGIKTGYTTKAGHSLIAGASRNGMELIAVTMNSQIVNGVLQTYTDSINLFEYAFNNYSVQEPLKAGNLVKQINIENALDNQPLDILAQSDVYFLAPKDLVKPYTVNEHIKPGLKAPIEKGTVVGYIEYTSGGKVLAKTNLIAMNSIQAKIPVTKKVKTLTVSLLVFVRNIVICVLLLIITLVVWIRLSKTKIRKKRKKIREQERLMKIERLLR